MISPGVHCFPRLINSLPGECPGLAKADGVEEDLGNQRELGRGHGHGPEEQLQVVGQVLRTTVPLVGNNLHSYSLNVHYPDW